MRMGGQSHVSGAGCGGQGQSKQEAMESRDPSGFRDVELRGMGGGGQQGQAGDLK